MAAPPHPRNGNGAAIPGRAFDVVMKARTLALLAALTGETVPVNGDRAWVAQATANLSTFDRQLMEAASDYDWLLGEVLLRLHNGDTAGMSLVDFLPPDTVLALWYAMEPGRRKYLRQVFGTVVRYDEPPEADRLAVLDRLIESAEVEVDAAHTLSARDRAKPRRTMTILTPVGQLADAATEHTGRPRTAWPSASPHTPACAQADSGRAP